LSILLYRDKEYLSYYPPVIFIYSLINKKENPQKKLRGALDLDLGLN